MNFGSGDGQEGPGVLQFMGSQRVGQSYFTFTFQVYAPTSNTEEAEVERFYEDLQDLLELTPQKDVLFLIESGIYIYIYTHTHKLCLNYLNLYIY